MKIYNMTVKEKTLDNGLHVILVHKPDYYRTLCTLATGASGFDLIQEVNGKRIQHRTGCAHYLEHQMFRLQGKDVTDLFAKMQASTNAFTTFNKTAYYFQTTADFKDSLKLLLDFVEELDIDQQSVQKEKGIILSEYDMYDQQPDQKLFKETWRSLYKKHPIRTDVLGTKEDIKDISVEDLDLFYRLNYDPSRLTLIVVTGKDIDEVLSWVEQDQKNVPSKILGNVSRVIEDESIEVYRTHYEQEMDISLPYVSVAYKFEPETNVYRALEKDFAIQMCLDALLSPLNPDYQSWLDEKIITQVVGAECDITTDHAYLVFYAQTPDPKRFIELIESLSMNLTQALNKENYEALKAKSIAANIRGLDQFENLAIELLDARLGGYDYWDSLKICEKLSRKEILEIVEDLDLSNKTITQIQAKSSK